MRVIDFEYECVVEKIGNDFRVVSYNSPYPAKMDSQSVDDILTALKDYNLVGEQISKDGKYALVFLSRLVENHDHSFEQVFQLRKVERVS